ncbi:MAG: cupin domain-containing protein [Ignavibacteriales bacterium]|nr:cupin domain-containing protein [Ignavibacteriales bacterium]
MLGERSKIKILIPLLFISFSCITLAQSDPGGKKNADSLSSKFNIENCVNEFSMEKTVKTDAGYQYWFIDKNFIDGRTLKMSVVAPHMATHAPHAHTEDEFFFILEGKADVYLNGKWKSVGPNTSFYCPSNIEHGIRNPGDKELKYLVIKKYEK